MGYNNNNRNNNNKSRDPEGNTKTERLRDGCSKLDWHDYHYPNCNEIHEIDMRRVIEYGKFGGRHKKKKHMDRSDDEDLHFHYGYLLKHITFTITTQILNKEGEAMVNKKEIQWKE